MPRLACVSRRGKYLWLPLADPDGTPRAQCLIAHLGMSGQLLVRPPGAPDEKHLHVRIRFTDGGPELRFVDQRTFGGVLLDRLVPAADRPGERVPAPVAHIARDPMDPHVDDALLLARLRRRDSAIKRALLDQSLVSGIGNIYADESLWRARAARPAAGPRAAVRLRPRAAGPRPRGARRGGTGRWDVLRRALRQRQRAKRLLRPLPGGVRPGGGAVPALRRPDTPGRVHEPVQLLLPRLPACASDLAETSEGTHSPITVRSC